MSDSRAANDGEITHEGGTVNDGDSANDGTVNDGGAAHDGRAAVSEVVNVGREQVHVVEEGPADGPPLLLSSGLGGAWFDWRPSADLLRDRNRVIAFDRPGLGLSPAAIAAPTLRREADVLAALAERAGRPVIAVAHSMAGFHAEALARLRPDLVRGLVLVDPSYEPHPHELVRFAAAATPLATAAGVLLGATRLARVLGPIGRRAVLKHTSRRDEPVPDVVVRSVYGRGTVLGTVIAEDLAYREQAVDLARLRERRPFPAVPLIVLTALGDVKGEAKRREWSEGHARLARMTPYGSQVDLPDARHMVQLDRPDAVADAVAEVLRAEETV
ncbi:(E)-2-((N-methylformamido)methylene)succinate hydrolase [Actinomadura sp. RB99]|uniref:alpha/beta fold hydrolase n=1 Tax=Actinomadura sp. RB99 TaxID=2691577 RepID=UPI0016879AB1|nr:alpha/beta hydrolase [Actinomadura sp. RB99]MBD2896118.1 (E)-2-((N-methylformamido)methylene)succinate hydrolase [Actinomadura sp. RB99]